MDCMEFEDRRVGNNINTLGRITDCCVCHTQRAKNVTSFVCLWATKQCWIGLTCSG